MPFGFGRKPAPANNGSTPNNGPLPPAAVVLDPFNGNPDVARAVEHFKRGDWRSVETVVGSSRDWANRGDVANALGDFPISEDWLRSTPDSSLAHSVRGTQLLRQAWNIRGSGMAESVAKTAWGDFFATLAEAERTLITASELDQEDPYPWAQLIWTGNGLQIPKDDILQRFAMVQARDPEFVFAWHGVITAVAKKWGGSHELMFDVARNGDRTLSPGSAARVAIARAHEERRLYYSAFEKDPEAAKAYFKLPEVANELSAAATNSVFSAQHQPSASTRLTQSWFAYALSLAGDAVPAERVRAAGLFLQLGDEGIPSLPWKTRYGARAGEQYARFRSISYRAAGISATS